MGGNRPRLCPPLVSTMTPVVSGCLISFSTWRRPSAAHLPRTPMYHLNSLSRDLAHSTGRLKIQRLGTTLTTWDIIHDRPGRIRLRHQTIHRNTVLASRLQRCHRQCSRCDRVHSLAGDRKRAHPIRSRFDQRIVSAANPRPSAIRTRIAGSHALPARSPSASGWPTRRWHWRSPAR